VFLGMAAGVGKTYRMLQEGQAEAESGRDVVIGYLESHGRAETDAQARDSRSSPDAARPYRETTVEEMDLPAILERAPELCLIDELAHTNAVGVEHTKRWEDVEDVLAAGIDVFSTVNVQHLESLNDQVADLTGTRVRETIPDAVLNSADEVVLIDLTPRALIERLRAGKIYRPDRIEAALNNFFKVENLAALREVALRQVAEEVEAKRLTPGRARARGAPDLDRGAAGRRRAAARADQAHASLAARRAPRLPLRAAPQRRARPAARRQARRARRARAESRARGDPPPGLGARCAPDRRGGRQHRRRRGARRA
jgi:two-component system sensor histidine kinase KdpD